MISANIGYFFTNESTVNVLMSDDEIEENFDFPSKRSAVIITEILTIIKTT